MIFVFSPEKICDRFCEEFKYRNKSNNFMQEHHYHLFATFSSKTHLYIRFDLLSKEIKSHYSLDELWVNLFEIINTQAYSNLFFGYDHYYIESALSDFIPWGKRNEKSNYHIKWDGTSFNLIRYR